MNLGNCYTGLAKGLPMEKEEHRFTLTKFNKVLIFESEEQKFMHLKLLIFLSLVLSFNLIHAQEHAYRFYTVYDGLPQSQVQCVAQDCTGYIWVGTKGGIARFDGFNFENFTINDGLVSNFVQKIIPTDSCIWFISLDGVTQLMNGKFIKYLAIDDGLQLAGEIGGQLIYCTKNKGNYTIKDNQWQRYKWFDIRLDTISIQQFVYIKDKKQLFFSLPRNKGLILFESGNFKKINTKGGTPYLSDNNKELIFRIFENDFYFRNTKYYIKDEIYKNLNFKEFNKEIPFAAIIRNATIFCFDRKHVKIIEEEKDYDINKEFNLINDVFKDKQGNYWVCDEDGLYYFWNLQFTDLTLNNSGVPKYVWNIKEFPKGKIWFASYGFGLVTLQNGHFKKEPILYYPENIPRLDFYFNTPIPSDTQMILATTTELFTINKRSKISFFVNPFNTPLATFYDSVRKQYLIGTQDKGLFIANENGKSTLITGNEKTFTRNILDICYDKDNDICLGTKGLVKFKNGEFSSYPNIPDTLTWRVFSLKKDHHNNLWLGTDQGLWFYNYDTIIQINTQYFKDFVTFLSLVDTTWLMGGTTLGLPLLYLPDFYKTGVQRVKYYDRFNGFNGRDCGQNGTLHDSENTFWIPTVDKVIRMDPTKISFNTIAPNVIIEGLSIEGDNLSWHYMGDTLHEFNNQQNGFKFKFIGLNYSAPERVYYQYRLLGYNSHWSDPAQNREAIFTNLDPGHYQFEVLACNEDGYWTNKPTIYPFYIIPDLWQRLWVQLLLGFIITGLFIVLTIIIMKRRAKLQLERIETQNKLLNMSLSTIKNQMDPHFTYNALNGIESLIMKEDRVTAYNYLLKLSGLIRETLNDDDLLNRTIDVELKFVDAYLQLEKFRFKDKFDYTIQIDDSVNRQLLIPKLIIQIFTENAIKHGLMHKEQGGLLQIIIKEESDKYIIIIEDNGIGREKAREYAIHSTGKGLNIVRKLMRIFNEQHHTYISFVIHDLHLNDKAAGTRVEINLPI